ncbi:MAG: hypothetical protein HY822_02640 [Acidobacteria bacterium]|nr:hypothetical protein [Acidobacteriota bacterium]
MKGLKQGLLLGVAAAAGGLAVWIGMQARERTVKPARETGRKEAGPGGVRLDAEAEKRAGIRTRTPAPYSLRPQLEAYGRVEEDPARSFTLRAPMGGTLFASQDRLWPEIGQILPDGAAVGAIEPRLSAADRISLTAQLTLARSEARAGESAAGAARAAFQRARVLNDDGKNVSDRVLQEAEAHWNSEEARWKAAQESVRLLEAALRSAGAAGQSPLVAARGGEVVEVMAHPGEAVESGHPVLRLSRLDRLLARVALPVGQDSAAEASRALLFIVGREDRPLWGERVALASSVDSQAQGLSLVFRFARHNAAVRPGMAVTARIDLAGPSRRGWVIPRAAVLFFGSRRCVYVRSAGGAFERRELASLEPVEGGYFTLSLRGGESVVVEGAQALLSQENKSGIALEVEGS